MRKFFIGFLIFALFSLAAFSSVYAAFFKFPQTTYTLNQGDTIEVRIDIDTEGEEASGGEVYLRYDNSKLSVEEVYAGGFFDEVSYQDNNGVLYIAGVFATVGTGKSGTGEFATVKFKANSSGEVTLEMICDPQATETSSIQKVVGVETQEIIDCNKINTASVTINGSGSSTGDASSQSGSTGDSSQNKGGLESANSTPTTTNLPQAGAFDDLNILVFVGLGMLAFSFFLRFLKA